MFQVSKNSNERSLVEARNLVYETVDLDKIMINNCKLEYGGSDAKEDNGTKAVTVNQSQLKL